MELHTLKDAERYLEGFLNRERRVDFDYARLGTRRIRALLEAVGEPQRGLPCVHIAGSKGKGTVALTGEALLRAAGRRVGTFTSPHLEGWCERFRIDGQTIQPAELLEALRLLVPSIESLRLDGELRPSFFDVCTALALVLFRSARVDAGVFEVGIGGRLDSTNVVESRVSVLTVVELEHTDKLGTTRAEIAGEKAGIFKPGIPVVHGPLHPDAHSVVLARGAALALPMERVEAIDVRIRPEGSDFALPDGRRVRARVFGAHLANDVALAIRACELWLGRSLESRELASLRSVGLPARVEPIGSGILDSAHTEESARALRKSLETLHPGIRFVTIVSIARDKDARAILREIAPVTRQLILCEAEPLRSAPADELSRLARSCAFEDVQIVRDPLQALEVARSSLHPDERLLVTGSFYLAGALRSRLLASANLAG